MPSKPFRSFLPWLAALGLACDSASVAERGRWQVTCGDPVCRGYQKPAGVPLCTSQKAGDSCAVVGDTCDPVDGCNRLLACSSQPPVPSPCPISVRSAKRDIRYLTAEELDRYARELRAIRLATYRYRDADPASPPRLGFVIDDRPPAPCVDVSGEHVDLYGYTSLAVATLQAQGRELEALRRELATLREAVRARGRD